MWISNIQILETSVLIFGALFSALWALHILVSWTKVKTMAWILLIASIWLLSGAYFFSMTHLVYPYFYALHFPFVFLCGPLLLHYYKLVVMEIDSKLFNLHLLPACVALLLVLPFHIMDFDSKISFLEGFRTGNLSFYHFLLLGLNVGVKVSILIYLTPMIAFNLPLLKRSTEISIKSKSIFIIMIILLYIDLLVGLIGFISKSFFLVKLSALLLPLNLCIFFILSSRYPEIVIGLQKELKKNRYENSKIKNLDVSNILVKLEEIFKSERAFADEDISLPKLAEELEISPHQLSQILNEKLNQTFPQYVNSYRVNEAKKLIAEDSERSILSIAFAVGFNSKASFNRAFKSLSGLTPQEFRKSNQK